MTGKAKLFYEQWKNMIFWVDMYLNSISDETLKQEITPGGNHGIWILGHLIASEDDLAEYIGNGEIMFPEYKEIFRKGGKILTAESYPSATQLRGDWRKVLEKNEKLYASLTDEELSSPHNRVLDDNIENDFFKTRERCISFWHFHQVHHAGQLALLKRKTEAGK
jgi:hypothetical protein